MSIMSVVCLSDRGLSDGPIPRPEQSYCLWCVIVCDVKTWRMWRPWPASGCCARQNNVWWCIRKVKLSLYTEIINKMCAIDQYFSFTYLFQIRRVSALLCFHDQGDLMFLVNTQHIQKSFITPCIMQQFTCDEPFMNVLYIYLKTLNLPDDGVGVETSAWN